MSKTTQQRPGRRKAPKRSATSKPSTPSSSSKGEGFLGKPPLALVVYGPSGIGKTSFAAHFPKTRFIIDSQEKGIYNLSAYNLCPKPVGIEECNEWVGVMRTLDRIASGKDDCQTVCIDSLTGMELLCFRHHCDEHFEGDWSKKGFFNYSQGPKNAAKTDWPDFLSALDEVREQGVNVVLLAHSNVKSFSNPRGADYDRYNVYMDKETWSATHRWSQAVFFANHHVEIDKKGGKNKPSMSVEYRYLYTTWDPAYDAKNQYGLVEPVDMGDSGKECYDNFVEAMKGLG